MQAASTQRYTTTAKLLHWLVLVLLLAQYALGWTMPHVHRGTQPIGLIAWHLSVGTALVLAMVVRLLWRLSHAAPSAPADLPRWMRFCSRATHALLYLLLLALPLMGWANASSRAWPVKLFGVLPLPPLSPAGSSLGHALGDLHGIGAWVLLGLIALHLAALVYHRAIRRDNVAQRMSLAR